LSLRDEREREREREREASVRIEIDTFKEKEKHVLASEPCSFLCVCERENHIE